MDSVITQVTAPGPSSGPAGPGPPTVVNAIPSQEEGNAPRISNNNVIASTGTAVSNSNSDTTTANAPATHLNAITTGTTSSNAAQKGSKKRSRRNFLCSIICCLGKRGSRYSKDKSEHASQALGLTSSGPVSNTTGADSVDARGGTGSGNAHGGNTTIFSSIGKGHKQLLPNLHPELSERKCIVIDLDETLVHSSFKPISNADFIVPVEIDGTIHQVYVLKRPFVDEFLRKMGELYECVLFTASLAKYADPVADLLDKWNVFHARLFRESCVFHRGNYVKDLSRLGRDLHKIIIVDNSPASYIFHPENAVPVSSWFDDMNDRELLELIPFLDTLSKSDNVYGLLQAKFNPKNASESNSKQ